MIFEKNIFMSKKIVREKMGSYWKIITGAVLGIIFLTLVFTYFDLSIKSLINLTVNGKVSVTDMVVLDEFIPDLQVELIYAGDNNVYGQRIYDINKAYLRRGTAEKLKAAQEEFYRYGYIIKVWDAYRPPAAQFKLWEIMPDARFVVNPYKGFSYHSRGVAIDLTLVDKQGRELPMPSGFDNFTALADRDYSDIDEIRTSNAKLLEKVMLKHGFRSIQYEWWHFTDVERDNYDVVDQKELAKK